MKTPSPLLVATLLLAAAAFSRADAPAGMDLASMSTFESGATTPGNCTEKSTARQFVLFHGTVKMSDVATHTDSDWISLDKTDDPVVKEYRQCLGAQKPAPVMAFSAMGLRAVGAGAVDSSLSVSGGENTPALLLGAAGRPDGASGRSAPTGGMNISATDGAGAPTAPATVGGSNNTASLSDPAGANDPSVFGNHVGMFLAQRGGSAAPGGNGGGLSAASASTQPGFIDGGAVADPNSVSLTYKGTVSADRRMHGTENQVMNSGVLAPAGGASQVPNPDAGNPQPLGFRATTNQ